MEDKITLEQAGANYAENQTKHFLPANDKTAFKQGGIWVRENELEPIKALCVELLKEAKEWHHYCVAQTQIQPYNEAVRGRWIEDAKNALDKIEKAKSLLNL